MGIHLVYTQMKGGQKMAYHIQAHEEAVMQQMRAQYNPESTSMRILHIVTALHEYDNGRRGTVKGDDRLQGTLIPVLSEAVKSMKRQSNWDVDVYLILGYTLRE